MQNMFSIKSHIVLYVFINQIGLLGVIFLVGCSYFVILFQGLAFYVLLIGVGMAIVLFPIDDELAFILLVKFLTKDLQKVNDSITAIQ